MADFTDILGDVAGGAATGAAFGPVGGVVGGLVGLGESLFGKKKPAPYQDPYAAQMSGYIAQDLQSNVGAQAAAHSDAAIQQNANTAYRQVQNDPGYGGNVQAKLGAYNQINRGAEQGVIGANMAGVQQDQNVRMRGLTELQQQQRMNYQQFSDQRNIDMQPTTGQQNLAGLLTAGAGALGGYAAQKLGKPSDSAASTYNKPQNWSDDQKQGYGSLMQVVSPLGFGNPDGYSPWNH